MEAIVTYQGLLQLISENQNLSLTAMRETPFDLPSIPSSEYSHVQKGLHDIREYLSREQAQNVLDSHISALTGQRLKEATNRNQEKTAKVTDYLPIPYISNLIEFSPDGKYLLTYHDLIELSEKREFGFPENYRSERFHHLITPQKSHKFSADSKQIARRDDYGFSIVEVPSVKEVELIHAKNVVGFSDDFKVLASIEHGMHPKATFYNRVNNNTRTVVPAFQKRWQFFWKLYSKLGSISSGVDSRAVFSPDLKHVLTVSDIDVCAWDYTTGTFKKRILFTALLSDGLLTKFSGDGRYFRVEYIYKSKRHIEIYDTSTWKTIGADTDVGGSIMANRLVASRDGRLMARSRDKNVEIFRSNELKPIQTLRFTKDVNNIALSADGKMIAVELGGQNIRIYPLDLN